MRGVTSCCCLLGIPTYRVVVEYVGGETLLQVEYKKRLFIHYYQESYSRVINWLWAFHDDDGPIYRKVHAPLLYCTKSGLALASYGRERLGKN